MRIKQFGFAAVLLIAGLLLAPGEAQALTCGLLQSGQLDLNVVAIRNHVKTLEVQKFVFGCDPPPTRDGLPSSLIKDLQLFTEIVEGPQKFVRVPGKGTSPDGGAKPNPLVVLKKDFQAISCVKTTSDLQLNCGIIDGVPPLPAGTSAAGCSPEPGPIAMRSAVVDIFVKTVKAQKEVFVCSTGGEPDRLVVVTTFTERIEKFAVEKNALEFFRLSVEVARCAIDIVKGQLLGCSIDKEF